jgi:Tryptophan-rich Synechocystis species C-terminal domain/Bacterial Ig domain
MLYVDGGTTPVGTGTVAADGSFDISTSTTFADGSHTLVATQADAMGVTSTTSNSFAVAVDPSAPTILSLVDQVNGSVAQVTDVKGTGEAGDTLTLYADGGTTPVGTGTVAANGDFDIITSTTFADGLHTLTATQTDAAGLTSAASPDFAVTVAPTTTVISEVGNHFFLDDSSGSGPSLKLGGTDVVAGLFGAWSPFGAVQTASGYEVAWKNPGANQYNVWTTDSGGNFLSQTGVVSGTDYTLESLESTFGQDLNGDGLIGSSTIGASDTLKVVSTYSGQVSFTASTGTLELLNSSSFAGTVAGMTAQDTIDFADIDPTKVHQPIYSGNASGGTVTVTDGAHTANIALLGDYMASSFVASSDGHGGTNVVDPSATGTSQTAFLVQPQHT